MNLTLDHVGIAVKELDSIKDIFKNLLEIDFSKNQYIDSQFVNVTFSDLKSTTNIELIEATSDYSAQFPKLSHPIKNFLRKKPSGIHHICFAVKNMDEFLILVEKKGIKTLGNVQQGVNNHKILYYDFF